MYAAGFHSGNQTTILTELNVTFNPVPGRRPPGPFTNRTGAPAPDVSLIVKWNGTQWVDERGQDSPDWSDQVKLSLPRAGTSQAVRSQRWWPDGPCP